MSVAGAIASFAQTFTVTRPGAVSYVEGEPVEASSSSFTIQASFQPLSQRDLLRLPEGSRESERRVGFTTTELRTGDKVAIGSRSYEVEGVEDWVDMGGYYRVIARREGD